MLEHHAEMGQCLRRLVTLDQQLGQVEPERYVGRSRLDCAPQAVEESILHGQRL